MSDLNFLLTMAKAHTEAAFQGKPQEVSSNVAEHMGAFQETGLSTADAEASMFAAMGEGFELALSPTVGA